MKHIFVDLDGCLISGDTLYENIVALIRKQPLMVLLIPIWILKGKASFKHMLASRADINPRYLAYNSDLLAWLDTKKKEGHHIYLATAANQRIAEAVCDHLKIFDGYLASTLDLNLSGALKKKAIKAISSIYGYVGDCAVDLDVWDEAAEVIVVGNKNNVRKRLMTSEAKKTFFQKKRLSPIVILKAIRVHQWAKNLLVFVPLLLAHQVSSLSGLIYGALAFVTFCLMSSAAYLINDLLDLEADRLHQQKRLRPLASGELSLALGGAIAVGFSLTALGLSLWFAPLLAWMLLAYLALTLLYSFKLKKIIMLDVLVLGSLYAWRMLAGAVTTSVEVSPWLVSFSTFFFLSLALSKRSSELFGLGEETSDTFTRRGYIRQDLPMINAMGVTTAMASLVVFSLYIYNPMVTSLYFTPQILWGEVLLLAYWIGRIWILTGRGQLHQDPVMFALRDRQSYIVGILMALLAVVASSPLQLF